MRLKKARKSTKINWVLAPDITRMVSSLASSLEIDWIKKDRIISFRSTGANTRAYARIWGLSRVWQQALNLQAHYIIEVISEKFDRLPEKEKVKVILHEITHIPKNFSGALMPHVRRGHNKFEDKVHTLFAKYQKLKKL